jgi:hypothetical protein
MGSAVELEDLATDGGHGVKHEDETSRVLRRVETTEGMLGQQALFPLIILEEMLCHPGFEKAG